MCIATSSPSVGNRCIFAAAGVGAVAFQAVAEPRLGQLGLQLLRMGYSAKKVLAELEATDPGVEWRQIGIVDSQGRTAVRTGNKNRDWAGHVVGDQYIALGNLLSGEKVTKAIAEGFEKAKGEKFEERLMRAIEAGRDAGGQVEGQTSSALLTYDQLPFAYVDLRVDHSFEPIAELRRIFDWHKPLLDYYVERSTNYQIPRHKDWLREQGIEREFGRPPPHLQKK
jgi:uncharacterized Ntn-hydrolase superfamily protein